MKMSTLENTQSEWGTGGGGGESPSNQDSLTASYILFFQLSVACQSFVLPSYSNSGPQQLPYPHFTKKSDDKAH